MAEVAKADGVPPSMGQSPFAIACGQTFERILFRNGGETLRESLVEAGVLSPRAKGFADFRLRMNGGRLRDYDQAIEATSKLLQALAAGKAQVAIIASATVRLPRLIMLPETILVADVVAVTGEKKAPVRMVGEIKTYPDRGGYTDGAELAQARAQAGVYVHGLRTANKPLTARDLDELERILVESGVGGPDDIERAKTQSHGLGVFARSLVGMDREAAKEALASFLVGKRLSANQIEFVNLIVDHLTEHGVIDAALLYQSPFTDVTPRGPDGLFSSSQVDELLAVPEGVRRTASAA